MCDNLTHCHRWPMRGGGDNLTHCHLVLEISKHAKSLVTSRDLQKQCVNGVFFSLKSMSHPAL